MKKLLFILTCVLCTVALSAQQLPHFSQYYLNDYLINPAIAGARPYFEAASSHRYQWEGITDAPRTYTLSLNGPSKSKKVGMGGYIFTDIVGPTRRTGLNFSYAYHMKVSEKTKLSFGISAGVLQFMIDGSKITLRDAGDQLIVNGVQSDIVPDAGFGTYIYHKKYYFGFSAPQLLNSKVKFFGTGENPNGRLPGHYFASGGYKFTLSDDFILEPSFFLKYIKPTPLQADGTLKIIYKEQLWLAGTFRSDDAITASLGYIINNKFVIAYGHDFTTTNIKNYSTGTHELMVAVRFYKPTNKSAASIE